jgi:hypothetical protein
MSILTVNIKSSILDIVTGNQGGVERSFLILENKKNKIDSLVILANKLSNESTKTFVEVKFESKYSQREKRLEVVTKKGVDISICKISNKHKFDKDALELSNICEELSSIFKLNNFYPKLYLDIDDLESYQSAVINMGLSVLINKL